MAQRHIDDQHRRVGELFHRLPVRIAKVGDHPLVEVLLAGHDHPVRGDPLHPLVLQVGDGHLLGGVGRTEMPHIDHQRVQAHPGGLVRPVQRPPVDGVGQHFGKRFRGAEHTRYQPLREVPKNARVAARKAREIDIVRGVPKAELPAVLQHAGLQEVEGLVGGYDIDAKAAAHGRGEGV